MEPVESSRSEQRDEATRKKMWLNLINKWLIWRLAGLSFWYWLIALRGHTLAVRSLVWLGALSFLPVFRHSLQRCWWKGPLQVLKLPFYFFLGFPCTVGFLLSKWVIRAARVTPKTLRYVTSTAGFLLTTVLFVVFVGVIPAVSNSLALKVLGFANLAVINVLFLCALSWASDPLSPLLRFTKGIWRIADYVIGQLRADQNGTRTRAESSRSLLTTIQKFLTTHIVDQNGNLRAMDRLRRALGPAFAFAFVGLFLVLVTGYSLTYYALQQAMGTVLVGLGNTPSLGICWFYSLSVATTAPLHGVTPQSGIGQLINALELTNAVMFLTIVLFLLSYAMGDRGKRALKEIRDYPKRVIQKLDGWVAELDSERALSDGGTDPDTIDIGSEESEGEGTS